MGGGVVENESIGMRRARLQDGVVTNGVLYCAGGGEVRLHKSWTL